MEKVTLNGESHGVVLPGFAEREELALAYNEQLRLQSGSNDALRPQYFRVMSAAIGLCVPRVGRRLADSGIIYEKCSADPLIYGGKVYDWFRKKGIPPAELARVGIDLLKALSESLAPKEEEVTARANFTDPSGES